ncbi:hypothetical protein J6590_020973 [Homalodisca vitripennis]|nr:hypothetical protein J6590_020973 [Homalodisca vitripennis]
MMPVDYFLANQVPQSLQICLRKHCPPMFRVSNLGLQYDNPEYSPHARACILLTDSCFVAQQPKTLWPVQ